MWTFVLMKTYIIESSRSILSARQKPMLVKTYYYSGGCPTLTWVIGQTESCASGLNVFSFLLNIA